jgi:hypothetical protein
MLLNYYMLFWRASQKISRNVLSRVHKVSVQFGISHEYEVEQDTRYCDGEENRWWA